MSCSCVSILYYSLIIPTPLFVSLAHLLFPKQLPTRTTTSSKYPSHSGLPDPSLRKSGRGPVFCFFMQP